MPLQDLDTFFKGARLPINARRKAAPSACKRRPFARPAAFPFPMEAFMPGRQITLFSRRLVWGAGGLRAQKNRRASAPRPAGCRAGSWAPPTRWFGRLGTTRRPLPLLALEGQWRGRGSDGAPAQRPRSAAYVPPRPRSARATPQHRSPPRSRPSAAPLPPITTLGARQVPWGFRGILVVFGGRSDGLRKSEEKVFAGRKRSS